MKPTYSKENFQFYDCYWIVRPSRNYLNWKTHLYLFVSTFKSFDEDSVFTIRKGITSNDEILETLQPQNNETDSLLAQKHVVPLTTGFYISFKGLSETDSALIVVYSAFSYKGKFESRRHYQ